MRVGIDLTALLPQHVGVDRYLVNLVRHLGIIETDETFYIFVNWEDRKLVREVVPERAVVVPLCLRPRLARLFFQQVLLPIAALFLRLDVTHSPSFIMPLFRWTTRHVLSIHDLTTVMLPQFHIPVRRSRAFAAAISHSARSADLICVPSETVRRDVLSLIDGVDPARVRVTRYGVESHFRPDAAERTSEVCERFGLRAPYFLFVGTIEPRKNVALLLRAFIELVADEEFGHDLVLAGQLGWGYADVVELLESDALRGRVHRLGYLPEPDLPALMAGATAFVYPSFQEGFGFPPLEAMACGAPTIVTDTSSLAENLGAASLVVPVDDLSALREAMARLAGDDELCETLRGDGLACAARFRWADTARTMVSIYAEAAGVAAAVSAPASSAPAPAPAPEPESVGS